jgi:hypothetical protein
LAGRAGRSVGAACCRTRHASGPAPDDAAPLAPAAQRCARKFVPSISLAHDCDAVLPLDALRALGRILAELRRIADAEGGIDWEVHMIDGTNVRAHRCAAGAKGGSIVRHWVARVVGSAASCTCAATGATVQWHLS